MTHLNPSITEEVRRSLQGLPLYQGGPGADITTAAVAYAVNITVVHIPGYEPDSPLPSIGTALLVQRASGHGTIGSWSGVSGYIDTAHDPEGRLDDDAFDPVQHTIYNELHEECSLTSRVLALMTFRVGERFEVAGFGGMPLHVVPVLGIWSGGDRPLILLDETELSGYQWVPTEQLAAVPGVNAGYVQHTLPRVLRLLG